MSEEQIDVLEEVSDAYTPGSGAELIAFTHQEGTAWYKKYVPGRNSAITNDDIMSEYYYHENSSVSN